MYIDAEQIPDCLVLKRWKMKAMEGIVVNSGHGLAFRDSVYLSRVVSMIDAFRELTNVACRSLDDYNDIMDWVANKKGQLFAKHE